MKILVVGAGFSGAVMAERLASAGHEILVVDKRDHIGGNCYDCYYKGVLIHKYGPHQFRTQSKKVKEYLSQFTEWMPYEVRSKSLIHGKYYSFPINRTTMNEVFQVKLQTDEEAKQFLEFLMVKLPGPAKNSEEFVISKCGWKLYEMFYKYYTMKQWGLHPTDLDASVCGRVPIRYNTDETYVAGKIQMLPKKGYTEIFKKMFNHPKITVKLNTGFKDVEDRDNYDLIIYTGPIDEFFDYKFGKLPYRSLRFEFKEYDEEYHSRWYKIAYPTMEYDQTRDIEIKYLTQQKCPNTVVMREFPSAVGDPYLPIPRDENHKLYEKYKKEADKLQKVIFIGRLAEYKYYDMDDVVLNSLNKFEELMDSGNV